MPRDQSAGGSVYLHVARPRRGTSPSPRPTGESALARNGKRVCRSVNRERRNSLLVVVVFVVVRTPGRAIDLEISERVSGLLGAHSIALGSPSSRDRLAARGVRHRQGAEDEDESVVGDGRERRHGTNCISHVWSCLAAWTRPRAADGRVGCDQASGRVIRRGHVAARSSSGSAARTSRARPGASPSATAQLGGD